MIYVEASVAINRPIEEVFDAISRVYKTKQWVSGVIDSRMLTSEPVQAGSRFHQATRFLGRTVESDSVISEYDAPMRFSLKSEGGPFPFEFHYSFETKGEGTKVTMIVEGETGGFFKLTAPIFQKAAKRQFQTDLENLKVLMEARLLEGDRTGAAV